MEDQNRRNRPPRRGRRPAPRGALLSAVLASALLAAGCGETALDTRTFELEHVDPGEAADAVGPYVYADRPDAPGRMSTYPGGITVRETEDNLAKIERVLERLDRPAPGLRLHFQIIRADGAAEPDPRIAEVEETLRRLFRFEGYRLLAEVQTGAVEGSSTMQVVQEEGEEYGISASVDQVRTTGQGGRVSLGVKLHTRSVGTAINTSMTVPVGRTVVLGSARPDPEGSTLILTVRPELVSMEPEAGGSGGGGA